MGAASVGILADYSLVEGFSGEEGRENSSERRINTIDVKI